MLSKCRKTDQQQPYDDSDDDWKVKIPKPDADLRPKTDDVTNTKGTSWEDLKLRKELHMGIIGKGFDSPSPVQEEVIPNILESEFKI